ncbi:MAG: hydroxyacylglutathione hydrolase [Enterobacteriaceae bacterium]
MQLIPIPALDSNYIWLLAQSPGHCIIVDPGDAAPVLAQLEALNLQPLAILLTHLHSDHTAGVARLIQHYPHLPVAGPEETRSKGATHIVTEGDTLSYGPFQFSVLSLPGHTPQHIAFYQPPWLFCGDVLFSAGCGRLFNADYTQQMYHSLQRIASLPDETLICCTHEYTQQNLAFAHTILPDDSDITNYQQRVTQLRKQGVTTLPSLLSHEKRINLFLRCSEEKVRKSLHINEKSVDDCMVFAELRRKKDFF